MQPAGERRTRFMVNRWLCFFLILIAATALADERVRQVQEELRKRNLYFGDIDGQTSADLANALKRYQTRKGFTVTGAIDEETATSLNISLRTATANPSFLPDLPVLKSDSARELPARQRVALQKLAEDQPDLIPTPAPPAESPPPSQDINPARVTRLVEQYLRDGETSDIEAQTRYFAYPVEYFDHGSVGSAFVNKDVSRYVKRWPDRKYALLEPVTYSASTRENETRVEFTISFNVRNKNHEAKGRTLNTWMIRTEGEDLKIVSIREQRLRE